MVVFERVTFSSNRSEDAKKRKSQSALAAKTKYRNEASKASCWLVVQQDTLVYPTFSRGDAPATGR